MSISWKYQVFELEIPPHCEEDESYDNFDDSVCPLYARETVQECKMLSNFEASRATILHLGELKSGGYFDCFVSQASSEKVIDDQIQWEHLNQNQIKHLIKENIARFKRLGYPLERLKKRAGKIVETYALNLSVQQFIDKFSDND